MVYNSRADVRSSKPQIEIKLYNIDRNICMKSMGRRCSDKALSSSKEINQILSLFSGQNTIQQHLALAGILVNCSWPCAKAGRNVENTTNCSGLKMVLIVSTPAVKQRNKKKFFTYQTDI
jgi:hypothetical protein